MKTTRRKFIKQTIIAGGALSLTGCQFLSENNDNKLVILHTNDIHSRIESFKMNEGKNAGKGGFVKLHNLIQQIRKKYTNILLFDSGDVFQGTPYFNYYHGELEYRLMSKMGYDAGTIGNHEFDLGIENIVKQMKHLNFPLICSNYDFSKTALSNKTFLYKIFQKGNFKVGVFGLGIALRGLVNYKFYKKTKYLEPVEIANQVAAKLKNKLGCNLVVCLSHLGYSYRSSRVSDIVVAQNSKNIDIILGGHTHTFMDTADKVKDMEKQEVIINQVGWSGMSLGKIEINYTKNKDKIAVINNLPVQNSLF